MVIAKLELELAFKEETSMYQLESAIEEMRKSVVSCGNNYRDILDRNKSTTLHATILVRPD